MNRNPGIDLVRVVGIVAIVAGHVWTNPATDAWFFTWHVPVFFFLTGYLWSPGRSTPDEFRRRARTLAKPYLFWLGVLLVAYIAVKIRGGNFAFTDLIGPLYGGTAATRPFTTFWFVFVLFATAVLWRVIERTPLAVRGVVLAVGLAASIWIGPELARTPLAIGTAIPALIFLAAGQYLRSVEPRLQRARGPIAVALLAAASVVVATGVSAPLNMKGGNWGTPVVSILTAIAISWALVILGQMIGERVGERIARAITGMALTGFTVVLVHPAVLWVVDPLGLPQPLIFALALAVPALVGFVALRTPLSQWATGAPRQRRQQPDIAGPRRTPSY